MLQNCHFVWIVSELTFLRWRHRAAIRCRKLFLKFSIILRDISGEREQNFLFGVMAAFSPSLVVNWFFCSSDLKELNISQNGLLLKRPCSRSVLLKKWELLYLRNQEVPKPCFTILLIRERHLFVWLRTIGNLEFQTFLTSEKDGFAKFLVA